MTEILLTDLKPNTWNPNQMTPAEYAELVTEVKHLAGPAKPIILRKNSHGYEIVDGEHTYKALLDNGYTALKDGWYEIQDLDDFEAMRQTYKRNQHGTHDPLKQGLLFKRMMEGRGLSGRELAKEMTISEGTVRNSLKYAEAFDRQPDFDFSKLSLRQVRYFLAMPALIGKLWLDTGADLKAALEVTGGGDDFLAGYLEWADENNEKGTISGLTYLEDTGLVQYLKPSRNFADCIKELQKWDKFETKWLYAGLTRKDLRSYTTHFLNGTFVLRDDWHMDAALGYLVDDTIRPPEFRLTPAEFEHVVTVSRAARESNYEFEQRLKLAIVDKSGPDALNKASWHVRERLRKIELEAAPDWIQDSKLSDDYKFMLWREFKDTLEVVKREVAKSGRISQESRKEPPRDSMARALNRTRQLMELNVQWTSRSEADIALTLSKRLCSYFGRAANVTSLQTKLLALEKEELLALDHYSSGMEKQEEFIKQVRKIFNRG